jgi:hypothetical protein
MESSLVTHGDLERGRSPRSPAAPRCWIGEASAGGGARPACRRRGLAAVEPRVGGAIARLGHRSQRENPDSQGIRALFAACAGRPRAVRVPP